MKAALQSIKPKYCELIASGKKTMGIRKTRPKIDPPFKVYMYCTNGGINIYGDSKSFATDCNKYLKSGGIEAFEKTSQLNLWNGKVIGEYICDEIIADRTLGHNYKFTVPACLDVAEVAAYCTKNVMYGWHISDLKIYDEPKKLSEFCRRYVDYENCSREYTVEGFIKLICPPQNWCYVEELEAE